MWIARCQFPKAGAGFAALGRARSDFAAGAQAEAWPEVPKILPRIQIRSFPKRDFDITKYGAAGDGVKDSAEAIARAIAECMNYSAFIYANGQENIAVTGEGTLDGNADADPWWIRARRGRPA